MLSRLKKLFPDLTSSLHKGSSGKVAVIGGSLQYTGAPYFAGYTALRVGADLVTVFTSPSAAPSIKGYSPELMVAPILIETTQTSCEDDAKGVAKQVISMLSRCDSLIIGPGLGRDPLVLKSVADIITEARSRAIPMIIGCPVFLLVSFYLCLLSHLCVPCLFYVYINLHDVSVMTLLYSPILLFILIIARLTLIILIIEIHVHMMMVMTYL